MWYFLLKIALAAVFMSMFAVFVFATFRELTRGWTAGEVRTQAIIVSRIEQPIYFWFMMTMYSCSFIVGTLFLISIPVYFLQW